MGLGNIDPITFAFSLINTLIELSIIVTCFYVYRRIKSKAVLFIGAAFLIKMISPAVIPCFDIFLGLRIYSVYTWHLILTTLSKAIFATLIILGILEVKKLCEK